MKTQFLPGASAHAVEQEVKVKKTFNAILAIAIWATGKPFLSLIAENAVVLVVKQGNHAKNDHRSHVVGLVYYGYNEYIHLILYKIFPFTRCLTPI